MQSRALFPLLVALACFAVACSSSTPAPPTDANRPSTCSSDAECHTGFKCDREQRRCVCTGDQACPTGKFCNAFSGTCVDTVGGCTSDSVCKTGEFCDRGLRTCKTITQLCGTCKTDAQCGVSNKCAVHPDFPGAGTFCVPSCVTPTGGGTPGCPAGLECRASATEGAPQLCFPKQGACGISNACTPDALAVCSSNADCTDATQQCDTTLKACVAKNRVCPPGDACDPQQRICVHACDLDSDCTVIEGTNGYKCRNNACFKLTTCAGDSDCPSKQICTANPDGSKSCRAGCTQATDCPLGQGCNNDPSHPRCSQGCTQNTDCPLNTICDQGACKSTFGGCTQACQTGAVCPIGSSCSSNNCCVAMDLATSCPSGCSLPSAGTCNGCRSVFPKACTIAADCAGLGNATCQAIGGGTYCQGTVQLKACTGPSDCPAKGFTCSVYACSSSASEKVCFPNESSAAAACLKGHL